MNALQGTACNCCSCLQDGPYLLFTISRQPFKIGPMFIWTFLLRITHTIISQSIADSSWITLYTATVSKDRMQLKGMSYVDTCTYIVLLLNVLRKTEIKCETPHSGQAVDRQYLNRPICGIRICRTAACITLLPTWIVFWNIATSLADMLSLIHI